MKVIRDAVHGDMEFTGLELAVLDTPEMQRLRGVKQLGTSSLVYPTAVHTRFEHSLGTCWLARKMLSAIERNTLEHGGSKNLKIISDDVKEIICLAALIHDITHIPYGHTIEDERKLLPKHDSPERFKKILSGSEIARILGEKTEAVLEILTVNKKISNEDSDRSNPSALLRPFMWQIVSDTVSADLLDYLARDAYFCGLKLAYDERIYRYFILDEYGRLVFNLVKKDGIFREDALSEILNLLRIRYTLTERVYLHHAKVATGAMIARAVEIALEAGLGISELSRMTDEGLIARMEGLRSRPLKTILERLKRRAIYKRAYVLTNRSTTPEVRRELVRRFHSDKRGRAIAEAELARKFSKRTGARFAPEDVIIYCPDSDMMLKEACLPVIARHGEKAVELTSLRNPEVTSLVEKYRGLWKFYVFVAQEREQHLNECGMVAGDYFSLENQLNIEKTGQLHLF